MNTTRTRMRTWYKVFLKSPIEGIYLSALNYTRPYDATSSSVVDSLLLADHICKYELNKRTKPKFGYIFVFEELEAAQKFKKAEFSTCNSSFVRTTQHPVILRGTGVCISAASYSLYETPKDAWKWNRESKMWMLNRDPSILNFFKRDSVGHWVHSFKPFEILPC